MSTSTEAGQPPLPALEVAGRKIGGGEPPLIIAEAGSAHDGDPEKARQLIRYARDAGADCIKFQAIYADEIVHPSAGAIRLPGGDIPVWERFRRLERGPDFYALLKEESEAAGLLFLCSPFGVRSAEMLLSLGAEALKIASPELNHFPLLERAAAVPLLISTGVSRLSDIEETVSFLESAGGRAALLHCITSYPAPAEEYNLRLIPLLRQIFGLPVGVSDHSRDPVLVPITAAAEGAAAIEKHITFPERGDGLDDPIALTPESFTGMCRELKAVRGRSAGAIRERAEQLYGKETVERVRGDGRKVLAPAERPYYLTTNRSLIALWDLEPGERLTDENCALLRAEQNRRPGLRPGDWPLVRGARLTAAVQGGDGISWAHLLQSD